MPGDQETWQRLFFFAVVLGCCMGISMDIVDPDLWGHVRYGQDTLAHGLARTATYTYSAADYPWINHENLAEVVFGWIDAQFGGRGLMAFKLLLGVPMVLAMFRLARRQRVDVFTQAVVAVLVSTNLTYGWAVRPQLFSYLCFFLLIVLLDWCFRRGAFEQVGPPPRHGWLWLTSPLFMLWANAHGGFVAGLCVLWAYVVGRGIEASLRAPRSLWPTALSHVAVAAGATCATLANPYGLEYWRFVYDAVTLPRVEITEWQGMSTEFELFVPFMALVLISALGVAFSTKRRDGTHLVLLALLLWQALAHTRHVVFFALAAGVWLPAHVDSAYQRLRAAAARSSANPAKASGAFRAGTVLDIALMLALVLLIGKLALRVDRLKVNQHEYPVSAFQFMADHGLEGRMVVTFNWAQYAIAAFGPRGSTVQFDGRFETCYPPAIAAAHFDFILGDAPGRRYRAPGVPPFDDKRAIREGDPLLVVIDRGSYAVGVMEKEPDWVLLYQDSLAQVWGRAEVFDDPLHDRYLPPVERVIGDAVQVGQVEWPALPRFANARLRRQHPALAAELGMTEAARTNY